MSTSLPPATPAAAHAISPAIRYHDAPAAIEWLARAFGLVPVAVHPDASGGVAHAELRVGSGWLMLSSARTGDDPLRMRTPRELGATTQCLCVVVDDPDAHHARAVAAGAEIVTPLEDKPYGGRDYCARDLEGHLWCFGTYAPGQAG